jgi:hypothetical protein
VVCHIALNIIASSIISYLRIIYCYLFKSLQSPKYKLVLFLLAYRRFGLLSNMHPVARTKQPAVDRKPLPVSEPSDADLFAKSGLGNTFLSKGFSFFQNKKSNVVNFNCKVDGIWRVAFRGSEILSWRKRTARKPSICLIGSSESRFFSI